MPTVVTRQPKPPRTPIANGKVPGVGVPAGDIPPEEAAAIRASVGGPEQGPSSEARSAYPNWRQVMDQLGDPYDTELIPISKLRMMRRDPIIGFGLSFIKTPHVRARWYIDAKDANGPNAQISAHLDHDLRRIMSAFVLQWSNSLDFGFQGLARRFELGIPSGTYVGPGPDGTPQNLPIWDQGNIQPIRWKPFVALRPETVNPNWAPDGSFNGMNYDGSLASLPGGVGAKPAEGEADTQDIDLYHSLWVTNERDQNFGSIFGYPRLGYAYRYWWSYWFRWSITDRAFEKKADPSIIVKHPEGAFVDPTTGQTTQYSAYALTIGTRMRSGGIITIPSTPYEGPSGTTNIPEWDIDFTKDMVNFDPFDKTFDYLDIGKIRSLWIPEQSLVEGKGGTSSRNVAAQLDSSFTESQAVMSVQIQETVNRWVIPQWLAVNYPEFIANQGTAQLVIQGFADEDVAFTQQILQLIGQQTQGINKLITMVDLQKILDDAGVPLLDIKAQADAQSQLVQTLSAQSGPSQAVAPKSGRNGNVGVVPTSEIEATPSPDEDTGGTNGDNQPSETGFSGDFTYIQPREVIYMTRNEVYGKNSKIKVKRVPATTDGVIARFDPDEMTVFMSVEASDEDANTYLSEIRKVLTANG
jgi:hypothetical protein